MGLCDEVTGHGDWEFAFEMVRGLGGLQGKMAGMGGRVRGLEGGEGGLGGLLREVVDGGERWGWRDRNQGEVGCEGLEAA